MSELKKLKKAHRQENTQFIVSDANGFILECDNGLFPLLKCKHLSEIHPFFLGIDLLNESRYTCVHLDINDKHLICDITLKPLSKQQCLIVISDFSLHYNSFQSLAQLRNETAIASELTEIDNEILLEKERFKNKFIANFSHEIISPIMSIMTFSNMLKNTHLNTEQQDYINVINESAYHLKAMVSDVLDLSKIETNNLEVNNKRFSLKKLIGTIQTEYNFKCKLKGLDLDVHYDSEMPNYVVSDKKRIHQIIKNLLDNALKFTNEGSISLSIRQIYRRARHLTFSIIIKDTGIGIEKENHDIIFERFTKVDSTPQNHGAGLGLTIVKEIINLINGTIEMESEANIGTTFTLNIRAKTPLAEISKKRTKQIDKELPADIKILLVDNNLRDQLSIFKILAKNKTFFLDIANSGQDAIELIKHRDYDLVLMDYYMPKLDGIKASKAIKKLDSDLPIMLITGSYINKNLLEYQDIYYKHILNKPFDEETLLKSIYMCVK